MRVNFLTTGSFSNFGGFHSDNDREDFMAAGRNRRREEEEVLCH